MLTEKMIESKGSGKETILNVWKYYYMMIKARPSSVDPTINVNGLNSPFQSL